jgi:hypothetical protein
MTPEGKVKAKVKKLLEEFDCWNFWPVQTGYGRRTVDALCLYKGMFFVIETKAPGEEPTENQWKELKAVNACGGAWFIIDGDEGVAMLRNWIVNL